MRLFIMSAEVSSISHSLKKLSDCFKGSKKKVSDQIYQALLLIPKAIDNGALMEEAVVEHVNAKKLIMPFQNMEQHDELHDAKISITRARGRAALYSRNMKMLYTLRVSIH